jgi:UDP-GlcNAc3NAcA epimerase
MKILTIIGARPQFIKAAVVSKAIAKNGIITEHILHTGQHFDPNMSDVFFNEMNIPRPSYQLDCGSGSHAEMMAKMLVEIEKTILTDKPDFVMVFGDTNSTLAGALTAAKLHIPVIHVEAGLRSFNKKMPEEVNRILTDHVSAYLFCPTKQAVENLHKESIFNNIFHVGDVMYDTILTFNEVAEKKSKILTELTILPKLYFLATVHRAENTDKKENLEQILSAFSQIASPHIPVILPLHPRTREYIRKFDLQKIISNSVKIIEPIGYLDMILLEKNANIIFTDSGGMQKEAYFQRVPCITLRNETEWTETVSAGWNQLVGHETENILKAVSLVNKPKTDIQDYGDGNSAEKIIEILCR